MVHEQPASSSVAPTSNRNFEQLGSQDQLGGHGKYDDLFKDLDRQPLLSRRLMYPGNGEPISLTANATFEGNCPTFRPPRPRTPHRSPSPRSATQPAHPIPPMPPSPLGSMKYSYSTSTHATLVNDANTPRYSPSRSSSTRSNYTSATSPTTGTASRSNSSASRRSNRPGPCPLPTQPGQHNSLAELQARQINIVNVQQPISAYAEQTNPLDKARYAVTGMVRRKSSKMDLGDENEKRLERKTSFARLGDVFGGSKENNYDGSARRGSAREADISKNF